MSDVTRILARVEAGDRLAAEELLPVVYNELRELARAKLARETSGHTLQPTALVHEAFLRLTEGENVADWENRRHFFAAAAEAMRRILIERARRRAAARYGGEFRRVDLNEEQMADDGRAAELLALDEAISELERHDPQAAEVVKLRYFAGLSHQEAADAMKISRRVADRLWAVAKTWLYRRLKEQ